MAIEIQVDDYIEGYEIIGAIDTERIKKKVKGWVNNITTSVQGDGLLYDIQCDDNWGGRRGNSIHAEYGVVKLETKPRPIILL